MVTLVAIDPGVHQSAVAVLVGHSLIWAGMVDSHALPSAKEADLVVWEKPQLDSRSRTVVPTILELAVSGAMLAARYGCLCRCPVEPVTPTQWKGSIPKPVHHQRLLQGLSEEEVSLLPKDSKEQVQAACVRGAKERWSKPGAVYYRSWKGHNVLDAVALGKWRVAQ